MLLLGLPPTTFPSSYKISRTMQATATAFIFRNRQRVTKDCAMLNELGFESLSGFQV